MSLPILWIAILFPIFLTTLLFKKITEKFTTEKPYLGYTMGGSIIAYIMIGLGTVQSGFDERLAYMLSGRHLVVTLPAILVALGIALLIDRKK